MIDILIEGAGFDYPDGTCALKQVDARISASSTIALTGPNGAGKTTLARLLNGLLVPTRGRVLVGEIDTSQVPASRVAGFVGYVFQNPRRQVFASTVLEEVSFGPRNLGRTETQVEEAVQAALEELDLSNRADYHPYELSQSELRRVALASVLAMQTPVVILDEPTASLDGADQERLLRVMAGLRRQGKTVLVITHDMDFVAEECERMLVLRGGQVAADGPPEEVFAAGPGPGLERPAVWRMAQTLDRPGILRSEALLESLRPGPGA
jgi:energy-coupling factor transporter ATP-binding protein EcfA2